MHFLASSGHCRFPEITFSLFDCLPEVKSPVNHSKLRIEFFLPFKHFCNRKHSSRNHAVTRMSSDRVSMRPIVNRMTDRRLSKHYLLLRSVMTNLFGRLRISAAQCFQFTKCKKDIRKGSRLISGRVLKA